MLDWLQWSDRLLARYPNLAERRADLEAAAGSDASLSLAAVDEAHVDDLLLAWAAGFGDREALLVFEDNIISRAKAHLRRRGFADWVIDEALQQARMVLLVAEPGGLPSICRYAGRGPLAAFVRVVVLRLALKIVPPVKMEQLLEEQIASGQPGQELESLRARYGGSVRAAVITAWRALPKHERFVLSLQLHGRQSVADIASLYGCHRVSAARKVASARAALLSGTRNALRSELGSSEETMNSVLRLLTLPVSVSDLPPATGVG